MASARDTFDVIVLGAGAAGLMCAISAGRRGRRVLLLEHGAQAGAKILTSGGGRCNFTNLEVTPERFLSANPHFCKSALSRYTERDFIAMVERHRIRYHEKTLGQLFCDGSAREILAMLLKECAAAEVDLRVGHRIAAGARDRDRRAFDSQNGRERLRLRPRAPLQAWRNRSAARPGGTQIRRRHARALSLAERRVGGGGCLMRPAELSRKYPVHPSRPLRPRHPSDLVVLARRRHALDRPRARARSRNLSARAQAQPSQGRA